MKHYKTFKELFCGTQIFLISSNNFMKYFYNRYCEKMYFLDVTALEENKQIGKN